MWWNKKEPKAIPILSIPKQEPDVYTDTYYENKVIGGYFIRIKTIVTSKYHPNWPCPSKDIKREIVPFNFESDLELEPEWRSGCTLALQELS